MSKFDYSLSAAQTAAVMGGSNIFLRACPGAGKTRSVAARAAMLADAGKSLALLSYTRVGASEIGGTIVQEYGVPLSDRHFIGTLHSFLTQYILRPYGHLITGSVDAMSIDEDAVTRQAPVGLNPNEFQYGIDGVMTRTRGSISRPDELTEMAAFRRDLARSGVVNFNDAISISLQVLTKFPVIARALADRFDEILIDEAQDTNEHLLACVRAIVNAGLKSLVLVGDYDQAIYEFIGSVPTGCENLASDVGMETRELRENFRSSQLICNAAAEMRGGGDPDIAAGPYRDLTVPPLVLRYDPGSQHELLDRFQSLMARTGLTIQTSAALVRKAGFAETLDGSARPSVPSGLKALVAAVSGRALTLDDYRNLEDIIIQRSFPSIRRPTGLDRSLIRARAVQLVAELPTLSGDLATWARSATDSLDRVARELSPLTTSNLAPIPTPHRWSGVDASRLRVEEQQRVEVLTIHSVKGRSIDAVMLVAQPPERAFHTSNADSWSNGIGRPRAAMTEELRLGYVAVTRARMLAVVAIPSNTPQHIADRWLRAGFQPEESVSARRS
ncbi:MULTISPECIES: UvrD-helicase domain-containing protein [unclassified Microbacterium]|uniref:UvrD-helicase domain-containing protein n=1 Tax=unclassified Microbacterium TaxID=2609290 RepID=UPI0038665C69